jgi:hypothetical protein
VRPSADPFESVGDNPAWKLATADVILRQCGSHSSTIVIGSENIHAGTGLSGADLFLKAATAAPLRPALSWNPIETKPKLPRRRRLSASDECRQVRVRLEWSPEQLATDPEDHAAS